MDNIISKVYKFKLDTNDIKPLKANINVNQLDSVLLKITITENKIPKNITNSKISLLVVKGDGTITRQTDDIEIINGSSGLIDILLKTSCLDVEGIYMAQLSISDEDESIRTNKFVYFVNGIIDGDVIVDAQDKISVLDELERRIDELNDKILESNGFSGDYNDLINKPIIDVNKEYVDIELDKKANVLDVYTKDEVDENIINSINLNKPNLDIYAKTSDLYDKVDKIEGKVLSSNDFTDDEKLKLSELTNYIHPNNSSTRHVSDAEKLVWNEKADRTLVTSNRDGLMSSAMKSKLDGIANYANNYVHPLVHPATMIEEDKTHRFVTDEEKIKWNLSSSFDGNYANLINKPTIPTKVSQLNNDSKFVDETYVNAKMDEVVELIPDFNFANYYNKGEVEIKLSNKSDKGHTHSYSDIDSLVSTTPIDGILTLKEDKYQKTRLVSNANIVFPIVDNFAEIHLFFTLDKDITITFPTCKWQQEPKIEIGKTYEFIFIYIGEWLGRWINYE